MTFELLEGFSVVVALTLLPLFLTALVAERKRKTDQGADLTLNFDYTKNPRYQVETVKLAEVRARRRALDHPAASLNQEITATRRKIEELEALRELDDIPAEQLENLQAERRRLDGELQQRSETRARLDRAIEIQDGRVRAVETELIRELLPRLKAEIAEAVHAAGPKFREACEANARIQALLEQSPWCVPKVSSLPSMMLIDSDRGDEYLHHPYGQTEVSRWFREARAAGYDV